MLAVLTNSIGRSSPLTDQVIITAMLSRFNANQMPVCPVMNFHRDGAMRHKITKGVNYWPNRFGTAAPQGHKFEAAGIISEYVRISCLV
jgi:catalase